ncbi:MAG: proton-conducting transporter membrane subunit [Paracoccaceae bacterium]
MSVAALALLAPLLLTLAAGAAFLMPAFRPYGPARAAETSALASIAVSIAAIIGLAQFGPATVNLATIAGLGLSFRLDVVSVTMLALVSFIGWVVLRFSLTYLDGEARQGAFTGWMSLTLASVMVLVTAGNLLLLILAWVGMALSLHRLLLFYPDRPAARRAARKKALTTGLGILALSVAAAILFAGHGTGDIAAIVAVEAATPGTTAGAAAAAGLLALAAVLKAAQFPVHGWLTEVMEAPTPVSALLHAGVVNAGGFLLIRFADVMAGVPAVLAVLVVVGGFTALVGCLVMLTQPAIKTALAWSTIAQMGFMILQCGLALFPLALLHIVAHSLYKAHAFLSSGGAVEAVVAARRPGPVAIPGPGKVLRAFAIALAIYVLIGLVFGLSQKSPQAIAVGAMLIFGVAYLIAQGLADAAPVALTRRTALASVTAALAYFSFQRLAEWLTAGTLPPAPAPGPLEWALILVSVTSFGAVALAQAMFPLWAGHPAAQGMRVHLANGLYANAILNRLIGAWSWPPQPGK